MVNWTEVCEQNRGLVYTIARRYLGACEHDPAIDIDDLMQTGYIGLMQAASTHDDSKGSFANWAAYYIRQEIRLMLSLHRKLPRVRMLELSLDAPLAEGEEPTLGDTVAADVDLEADAQRKELVQAVRAAVDRLPEEQRSLVRLCDLQGRSLDDAAKVCGATVISAKTPGKRRKRPCFWTSICVRWPPRDCWTELPTGTGMSASQTTAALGFPALRRWCSSGRKSAIVLTNRIDNTKEGQERMMDLIHIEDAGEFPIRGRELHERLGIETRYNDWFKHMCEYGFEEGKDFETVLKNECCADGAIMPQQSAHHLLTVAMAKELCMLQRTGKGGEVRRHLIRLEEQWNQPDAVIARGLQLANRKMEALTGNLLHPDATSIGLNSRVEADAPRVHFAESLEGSDSSLLALAKLLTQNGGDTGEK